VVAIPESDPAEPYVSGKDYFTDGYIFAPVYNLVTGLDLFAQWSANSYVVNYVLNGGLISDGGSGTTGTISPKTAVRWWHDALLPDYNPPSRDGYAFNGWNVTSGGKASPKVNVQSSDKYSDLALNDATASITLTAQWNPIVTFDKNASDAVAGSEPSRIVSLGTAVGTLPGIGTGAPTRTNYVFQGWSTVSGSNNTVDFLASAVINTPITVYAVWLGDAYSVTYHDNIPSGVGVFDTAAPVVRNVNYGDIYEVEDNMFGARAEYNFLGWSLTRGGAVAYEFEDLIDIEGNVVLYAVWAADAYVVTYAPGAGAAFTEFTEDVAFESSPITMPDNSSPNVATGYNPATMSWVLDKQVTLNDGLSTVIPAGTSITPAQLAQVIVTEALTATANFELADYTINYLDDDSTLIDSITDVKWSDNVLATAPDISSTRPGSTFEYWTYNGVEVTSVDSYSDLAGADDVLSIDLIAYWTENDYTINYLDDDGLTLIDTRTGVKWADLAILSPEPTRRGYVFGHWTVYSGGPSVDMAAADTYGDLVTNDAVDTLVLIANWEPNSINIIYIHLNITEYHDQNDTRTIASKVDSSYYDSYIASAPGPAPTRLGYNFKGWALSDGTEWLFGSFGTELTYANGVDENTDTLTLYALWSLNVKSTVTVNNSYAAAGLIGGGGYDEGALVTINAGTRRGYDFTGWTSSSDLIALGIDRMSPVVTFTMPGHSLSLTANWKVTGSNLD
jgi:uncharacterized repeat protein (TIGR02543 family)